MIRTGPLVAGGTKICSPRAPETLSGKRRSAFALFSDKKNKEKLLEWDQVVWLDTSEVIPVLVVATTEQRQVVDDATAMVDWRQVVADRTDVRELDVLLDHTLTTSLVLGQLTTRRCKYNHCYTYHRAPWTRRLQLGLTVSHIFTYFSFNLSEIWRHEMSENKRQRGLPAALHADIWSTLHAASATTVKLIVTCTPCRRQTPVSQEGRE